MACFKVLNARSASSFQSSLELDLTEASPFFFKRLERGTQIALKN